MSRYQCRASCYQPALPAPEPRQRPPVLAADELGGPLVARVHQERVLLLKQQQLRAGGQLTWVGG